MVAHVQFSDVAVGRLQKERPEIPGRQSGYDAERRSTRRTDPNWRRQRRDDELFGRTRSQFSFSEFSEGERERPRFRIELCQLTGRVRKKKRKLSGCKEGKFFKNGFCCKNAKIKFFNS